MLNIKLKLWNFVNVNLPVPERMYKVYKYQYADHAEVPEY